MDELEMNSSAFECDGINVTVIYSNEGRQLQECIVDILKMHIGSEPRI